MTISTKERLVFGTMLSATLSLGFLHCSAEASEQSEAGFNKTTNDRATEESEVPTSDPAGVDLSELFQLEVVNDAESGDRWLVLRGQERGLAISGDGENASLFIDKWGGVYLDGDVKIFGSLTADDVELSNGRRLSEVIAAVEATNGAWWKIRGGDVRTFVIVAFVLFLYRLSRRASNLELP